MLVGPARSEGYLSACGICGHDPLCTACGLARWRGRGRRVRPHEELVLGHGSGGVEDQVAVVLEYRTRNSGRVAVLEMLLEVVHRRGSGGHLGQLYLP